MVGVNLEKTLILHIFEAYIWRYRYIERYSRKNSIYIYIYNAWKVDVSCWVTKLISYISLTFAPFDDSGSTILLWSLVKNFAKLIDKRTNLQNQHTIANIKMQITKWLGCRRLTTVLLKS